MGSLNGLLGFTTRLLLNKYVKETPPKDDKKYMREMEKMLENEGWRKSMNHIYVKDGEMINTMMFCNMRERGVRMLQDQHGVDCSKLYKKVYSKK